MIFIRLLSVNKTNCNDLRRELSYEILNWHYLCTFLTSSISIRLRRNFGQTRIFAGFGKNAGFWPEPDSGATLIITELDNSHLFESVVFSSVLNLDAMKPAENLMFNEKMSIFNIQCSKRQKLLTVRFRKRPQ